MPHTEQMSTKRKEPPSLEGRVVTAKRRHRYECSVEGCSNKSLGKEGVCWTHGAKKDAKICNEVGCINFARGKEGICKRHGAKVKPHKICSHEGGCTNLAVRRGVCIRHGAKAPHKRCSHEGCTNQIINGGVCVRHGATWTKKKCSAEGCSNLVKNGGVCISHGATQKKCSQEGCTNHAKKGGVCRRHGAKFPLPKTCIIPQLEPFDRKKYLEDLWEKSYCELADYKNNFGQCNVPINYEANASLGAWVFSQRMAYKKGKLSEGRIEKLNKLGFLFASQK